MRVFRAFASLFTPSLRGSLTQHDNGLSKVHYDISKSISLSIFDDIQNNMHGLASPYICMIDIFLLLILRGGGGQSTLSILEKS